MQKSKTIQLMLLASFCCLFFANDFAQSAQLSQADIKFYGRVVDQFDAPVAGARVNFGIRYLATTEEAKVKTITLTSDSSGLFSLDDSGSAVYSRTIEKDGYEFLDIKSQSEFDYSSSVAGLPGSSANNPVIFYMRKKNDPAFLLRHSHRKTVESNKLEKYYLDLHSGNIWTGSELVEKPNLASSLTTNLNEPNQPEIKPFALEHIDLLITPYLSEDESKYELSFDTFDANNGVIVSDELLYEAPNDGYMFSTTIEVAKPEKIQKTKKFLYIKARNGRTYARIDLSMTAKPDILVVKTRTWTNPDSSRNLEYDKAFQQSQFNTRFMEFPQYRGYNSESSGLRHRLKQQQRAGYNAAKERQKNRRAEMEDTN